MRELRRPWQSVGIEEIEKQDWFIANSKQGAQSKKRIDAYKNGYREIEITDNDFDFNTGSNTIT